MIALSLRLAIREQDHPLDQHPSGYTPQPKSGAPPQASVMGLTIKMLSANAKWTILQASPPMPQQPVMEAGGKRHNIYPEAFDLPLLKNRAQDLANDVAPSGTFWRALLASFSIPDGHDESRHCLCKCDPKYCLHSPPTSWPNLDGPTPPKCT